MATVSHCRVDEVFAEHKGDGVVAYLAEYLKPFATPILREKEHSTEFLCLNCGSSLNGFLLGTFQWGIVHGEGFCSKCHWPARLYHYLKLPDGTEGRIVFMLQYHPDFVKRKKS